MARRGPGGLRRRREGQRGARPWFLVYQVWYFGATLLRELAVACTVFYGFLSRRQAYVQSLSTVRGDEEGSSGGGIYRCCVIQLAWWRRDRLAIICRVNQLGCRRKSVISLIDLVGRARQLACFWQVLRSYLGDDRCTWEARQWAVCDFFFRPNSVACQVNRPYVQILIVLSMQIARMQWHTLSVSGIPSLP
jgi:hypothetical protein